MSYSQEKTQTSLVHSEDGSVSLISLVFVLGLAVLIGFAGNMAHETVEREKLQNATDAAAYSSAVWMARGMNTVSTFNHIIGELTSLVVIIEALGGPEAEGENFSSNRWGTEEAKFNLAISALGITAPEIMKLGADIIPVNRFVRYMVNSHPMHSCGAGIYDAEVNLKMHATVCLTGKFIGNVLESLQWIPFGIGPALLVAGKVLHFIMNIYMKVIEVETRIVRTLEKVVSAIAFMKSPLRKAICIMDIVARNVPSQFGVILKKNAAEFQRYYSMKSITYSNYRLPVMEEPWSDQNAETTAYRSHPWGGDGGTLFDTLADKISKAQKRIDDFDFPDWFSRKKRRAKRKLAANDKHLVDSNNEANNIGWKGNPSIDSLSSLDVGYEQKTQLVRATFPYVDMYRTPLRDYFAPLMLSKLKTYFTAWTFYYTLNESFNLHKGSSEDSFTVLKYVDLSHPLNQGVRLWVMKDTNYDSSLDDKGNEPWTDSANLASECFSVVVAGENAYVPPVFSPSVFKKARTEGMIAFSQAMIYNLNGRNMTDYNASSRLQPNSGWDTLQWRPKSNIAIEDGGEIIALEWLSEKVSGGSLSSMIASGISRLFSRGDSQINENNSEDDISSTQEEGEAEGMISVPTNKFFDFLRCGTPEKASVKLNWQAKLRPVDYQLLPNVNSSPSSETQNFFHVKKTIYDFEEAGNHFLSH